MPDEWHDHGAHGRADQSGTFAGAIPADGLAEKGGDERTDDAEHHGEDEAGGIVGAGSEQTSDQARDEADDDDPENAHGAASAGIDVEDNRGPPLRFRHAPDRRMPADRKPG